MTQYLSRPQVSAARSRLTRAKKRAAAQNEPELVIAEVDRTFSAWDDGGYAYPDAWHTWEVARQDAQLAIRYGLPYRS